MRPGGPQLYDGVVEFDADAAAHADDHRLAVHGVEPSLPVIHDVLGDEADALLAADHRFQPRPLALEFLLRGRLFLLGHILEFGIDLWPFLVLQFDFREAAFVEDADGCVVLEEVEFNYFSSRVVSNRSVVFDDGRQLEQVISIRAYSLHELGKLLHAAGFRVIEVSGGMHNRGRFFGGKSRDIVVVAERRAKERKATAG